VITLDKCLVKKTNARWKSYTELIKQLADALRRVESK